MKNLTLRQKFNLMLIYPIVIIESVIIIGVSKLRKQQQRSLKNQIGRTINNIKYHN